MKQIYKPILIVFFIFLGFSYANAQAQAGFTVNLPSPACNPAVVSFTNTTTGGIPPLKYVWNFGVYSGNNSIFENPTTTYIHCGTFTVTLYVTDGSGKVDSAKQSLTIECSPTADFSISSTHGCSPFTTSFTDLSTPGDGTIASELWDFGDGYLGSGPDPSHTYTAIGCNTITLIVKNSFGCKADTTVQSLLCVYKPPVVNFTSSNPTSCASPFTVNFDGTASSGLGPYSYLWNFTNATPRSDTAQDPSATFNATGASNVQVIVTDANNCRDTVTKNSYVNIAKNSVNFTLNSTTGCAPFNVWANSNVTGNAQSYEWTLNPVGITSNGQNANFNITTPGTDSLCLTVDFKGGCSATTCKTFTVYPPPTADFFIAGNYPTCLIPSQLTFTDNSSGDSLNYSWNFPGGSPDTSTSQFPPDINYNTCGSFSASLTVTDAHGCSNTMSAPDMFTITCLHPAFSVKPDGGCTPLTSLFNSSASTGGPFSGYLWNFGDPSSGTADTSTSPNPSHTYNNKGCYDVTLIVYTGEGCTDTITVHDAVCAGQKPHPAFSNNPPTACANAPVTFTNETTNTDSTTQFQWDFKGGPNPFVIMSTDSNPTYIYNDTGWFNVTLVAIDFGCSDTITYDSIEHVLPPIAIATLTRDCANPYVVTLDGTQSIGADTYTWTIPGGNPSSASTPTVSVTYLNTGNYTASLFVTNDSTDCSNNTSLNITITDVVARFSGSPLQGCAPLTSCMSNSSIDGASYLWTVYNHATGQVVTSSTQKSPCFSLSQPGIYDVKLVAADQFGCKDSLIKSSYISVWGVIAGFYGTPLQGCTPLFVQFTDTSSSSTSTITGWSWNFGDPTSGAANTSHSKNPIHTYHNSGFYSVQLTVSTNHGCSVTIVKPNYVNAVQPAANFSLTDTDLCFGTVACFINSSTGNSLTYSWNFGNGNTSDSITPCITYYTTGFYTIVLAVKDKNGCVDTITKHDYVNVTKPIANFVADTTHSSCPPLEVQFVNLSTQIDTGTTYFWDFGDSSVSIIPDPIHIYNLPGSYTVTLIVTNKSGCSDTLTIPNYITIGGPKGYVTDPVKSGCNPLTTCFDATAPSAKYFTWNFGDGNVESAGDSICYTYTRPGTFHPELILNDGAGCIYALPIGTIKVGGSYAYFKSNADTLCGPGSINFTDSSWSFVGISSRTWDFGDPSSGFQNSSSSPDPSHYYSTPGTYFVTLNISSFDGCNSKALDTVVVKPLPVASFIMSKTSVCPPSDIQFTNQSTSTSPIISYLWNFDDAASGVLDTSSQLNPSHLYTLPGTYNITLTIIDSLGCSAQTTSPLVVHPPALANAGNNKSICLNTTGTVLNATGGVQYSWTPSNGLSATNVSSPSANPTITTTYEVVVSTVFGCVDSAQVIVRVNPVPQIDSSLFTGDTCSSIIGSASVFVSNGTMPYSYTWSNSGTTASITNLHGGITYTVTVTDSNSCVVMDSVSVPALPPPGLSAATVSSTCSYANGSINLTLSGGQAPFTFSWNNGATTQNLSNILAGPYSVTVTDAFKCTSTLSVTVNNFATPAINLLPVNTTCSAPNGSINLVVSGGTSPFTYNWSNGATTQNLSSILAGNDSVTVTDANGCSVTGNTTLIDHPGPVVTATQSNATCNAPNASINLTVSGGTSPFTYNWNNGYAFTQDVSNIYSGNYNVMVTDSNSCKDSLKFVIGDTPKPKMSFVVTGSTCGFANGAVTVTVSAGIAPFTFAWSNNDTTQNLTNVKAGNYQLTITGANGCTIDTIAGISDLVNAPVLTANPVQPTCGFDNGAVNINISGGHAPYVFNWNSGTWSTQNLDSLTPGNYFVQVTDSNGCIATANASLSNIAGPVLNATSNPSTCGNPNGSINLQVVGGIGPFSFSWNNSATTQNLNNLMAGNYNVTVSDVNNCIAALSQGVTNIGGPSFTFSTVPTTCTLPNGSINLNVTGGTTPYSFSWNNGAYTGQDLSNVLPGNYNIVITDGNGCTTGGPILLIDSAAASLSVAGVNPTCGNNNGSVNLTVSGYGPFSYSWNSGSYSTQDINNLTPGIYSVVVTDMHNCTSSAAVTLNNIAGPVVSGTVNNATCGNSNGAINLSLSGGTTPFTYQWSDSAITQNISSLAIGNYSVIVVDSNGCTATNSFPIINVPGPSVFTSSTNATCGNNNGTATVSTSGGISPFTYQWNNAGTTQTISNLLFGTYYATVTDANGCSITDSVVVTGIKGPSLSDSTTNTFCGLANGNIRLVISGGTAPFTYNWNSGEYASQDLYSIPAGNYNVVVTDANGCQALDSAIITDTPGPSSLSFSKAPSTCGKVNGMAMVTITGGTRPYTYLWGTTPAQTDSTASNLSGNNSYQVTVTDANGCSVTGSIFVPDIAGPTVAVQGTNATCGLNNGAINVSLSSGTAPFSFTWSNGATTQNLGNLSPALYQLIVSDLNGCADTSFVVIDSTSKPILTDSIVNTTCGRANGAIYTSLSGGASPYSYNWNNGSSTQNITSLNNGNYSLLTTDASGCQDSIKVSIKGNPAPVLAGNVIKSTCGFSNGAASVTPSGGTAPFNYLWNNSPASTDSFAIDLAGNTTYIVLVSDSNGCTASDTLFVPNIAGPALSANSSGVSCGNSGGSIDLTATSGTPPYSYSWNNGKFITPSLGGLPSGNYVGVVTDALGCQAFTLVKITAVPAVQVSGIVAEATCGKANGSIELSVSSGTSPYSVIWNSGDTSRNISNIDSGTYIVTITDFNLCTAADTFNLKNSGPVQVTYSVKQATCNTSNGSINISVNGGTLPYHFSWNTGDSIQNLLNIAAGTYSLTVTDSTGRFTSTTINIGNINGPLVNISAQNPTCDGDNGTINLTVTGASTLFSFSWSDGATNEDLSGLSAGDYIVTVTDSLGCKTFDSVAISNGSTPQISYVVSQPTCGNNNGSINVSVKSGKTPYSYSWNNNSTTQNLSGLGAGVYELTVKDSLGCADTASIAIHPSSAPVITLTPSSGTICIKTSATIIASGADSYTWSPASSLNKSTGDTVTATISSATTFTVTGSDTSGCSATQSIALNVYTKSIVAITTPGAICKGSSTTITVAGNGNYTWAGPSINGSKSGSGINITPDTTSIYYVYFNDGNGCPDTSNTTVSVVPIPAVNMLGLDSAYCFNATPDTLIGTPAGGTFAGTGITGNIFSPAVAGVGNYIITYTYTDSTGCSNSISKPVTVHKEVSITAVPGSPTICHFSSTVITASGCTGYNWSPSTGLSATTGAQVIAKPDTSMYYTVIGTDSHGCSASTIVAVTVASKLAVTLTGPSPTVCLGNNATLSVSGANTYTWSPATGLNATSGSSVVASPTINSTYTITGTDVSGCTGTEMVVVNVNPLPVLTTTPDTFVCNGSAVPLEVDGARSYVWSPSSGLNSSTGSLVLASPNASTTYNILGTDINGCTAQKTVSLGVKPNPVITASNNNICFGQSGVLTAAGGSRYTWSPSDGLNASTGSSVVATIASTSSYVVTGYSSQGCTSSSEVILTVNPVPEVNFSGLDINYCINNSSVALTANPSGGTFSGPGMIGNVFDPKVAGVGGPYNIVYSYTNNNGCSARDTQPVNVHAQPDVKVNNASVCTGNTAQLIAQGATTYSWSPSTGLDVTTGPVVNCTSSSPIQYTVTGSSITGCSATTMASVSVLPPPQLVSNITSANICTGGNVFIEIGGAQNYLWSPSAGLSDSNSNKVTVTPASSTVYTIIGQNSAGCADTIMIPVNVLSLPTAVAGPNADICQGSSAQLSALGSGTISWSPAQNLNNSNIDNPVASPEQTTTYTLTVTDSNGCTATDQLVVNVYSAGDFAISGGGTVCLGDSANLSATGGYDYRWNPPAYLNDTIGERVISKPASSVTYTVTANSSIGCPAIDSVVMNVRNPIYVKANAGATLCDGESYQLNAYGDGVTYQWSPSASLDNPYIPSPVATPSVTTTYTVISSDLVCFTASDSTVLIVRPRPDLQTQTTISVIPGSGQQLYASGSGTFEWTPPTGLSCTDCPDPIANPTVATTYTVTETDSAGCRTEATVKLSFLCDENGIYVPNAFTPNGDGKNDVFRIRGYGITSIRVFRVYSRWGQLVFETNDINQGWDGTFNGEAMFPAVYVYYIEGICTNNQVIIKQGNVTLIR